MVEFVSCRVGMLRLKKDDMVAGQRINNFQA